MTTTVVTQAHCAKEKEVHIRKVVPREQPSLVILQDGEENRQVVYDGLEISVREVEK